VYYIPFQENGNCTKLFFNNYLIDTEMKVFNYHKERMNRLMWADSLRGMLIILVILGHAIQYGTGGGCFDNHLWNMIYSFHMPAFMAISGWFAYRVNRDVSGYYKNFVRRILQLLIPYFIWSILKWITMGANIYMIENIILQPDSYFWFLWVLFWICSIFLLSQWIAYKLRIEQLILIIINSLLLMGIMVSMDIRVFGFQFIAYYFIFFTMGYCIRRYRLLQIKSNVFVACFIFVWMLLAWFWNMHELPSWIPNIPHIPMSLLQYAYRGITAVIAISIIFSMSPKLLDTVSAWNIPFVRMGQISLGIYVVHLLLIPHITRFIGQWIANTNFIILSSFVIVGILSMIIVSLLNKWQFISRLFLGKI